MQFSPYQALRTTNAALESSTAELELTREELKKVNGELRDRVRELEARASNQALEELAQIRRKHLALVQNISRAVDDLRSWHDALQTILKEICQAEVWQLGHVYVPNKDDPDELTFVIGWCAADRFQPFFKASQRARYRRGTSLPGEVCRTGKVVWLNGQEDLLQQIPMRSNLAREMGLMAALAMPVAVGRETIAVLELFSDRAHQPSDELSHLMSDVSSQIGRAVERERLLGQVAELVWQEQQKLLHTLHDSLGQELTGVGMLSSALRHQLADKDPSAAETAQRITEGAQRALAHVRQLSKGLFPVEVDAAGLTLALGQLAATTEDLYKIRCRIEDSDSVLIQDNRVATELYRI